MRRLKTFLAILGALCLAAGIAGGVWWLAAGPDRWDAALERVGLRQSPLATAESSLSALRAMNELTVLEASFVGKATSTHLPVWPLPQGIFASSKTLYIPGSVRYVVDLAKLEEHDLSFDRKTNTLTVRRPPVRVTRPRIDMRKAKDLDETKDGTFMLWLSGAGPDLDRRNVTAIVNRIRDTAQEAALVDSANRQADKALADLVRLPLAAAGHADVRVVVKRGA